MRTAVLVLLAAFGTQAAYASDEVTPWQWLAKMRTALQTLNYHGTLIYLRDGRMETMRVVHKRDGDREVERLMQLTGMPREIVREDDVVTCYLPENRSVVVGHRRFRNQLLTKLAEGYEQFRDYYELSSQGNERIAGQMAHMVLVEPLDQYRYGYKLWIDRTHGLLLKSDLLDENGHSLEQLMFAEVQIVDSIPSAMVQPALQTADFTWFREEQESLQQDAQHAWRVTNLPAGFTIQGRYLQQMPNNTVPTEHLLISDGLASISVYIEKQGSAQKALFRPVRVGAVNVYSSALGDRHITVIGEAPQVTVKAIAESVVSGDIANQ